MSRIDEALQRRDREAGTITRAPEQSLFKGAWADRETVQTATHDDARSMRQASVSFSSKWGGCLVNSPDSDPQLVEQFRRLASTLHKARRLNGLRSVMVTSATSGDGKTLTAVNLALELSRSFNSEVLLIDADLRRPSIPSVIELTNDAGLSEALTAKNEQRLAMVRIAQRLTLIPAGQPISNSIEALSSVRMQRIVEEAIEKFDWVILDAPPVGLTTDARVLAELVGGTLLVVRAGHSPHNLVAQSIAALGRDQILGVVLNGAERRKEQETYYEPKLEGGRT